ncbi:MAG: dehydrogenase, partial [Actinomycetota bacterium]|nr:dehydrogenase [Actinomycetota bacterium]
SQRDYDVTGNFLHHRFRIVRQGTDGNLADAEALARSWQERGATVVAVTGIREARAVGLYHGDLDALQKVRRAVTDTLVTDGHRLRDILQEWAVRHVQDEMPGLFNNARVAALGGDNHDRTVRILREYTDNITVADPLLPFDIPARLDAVPALAMLADVGTLSMQVLPDPIRSRIGIPHFVNDRLMARTAAREADVVVATYEELTGFGLEDLAGKTLVTASIDDERLTELASRGVDMVIDATPQPFAVTVNAAVLEALMMASVHESAVLSDDDLLDMITSAGIEPRLLFPNGPKRKSRFAFVIHPLSQENFTKVQPLRTITGVTPAVVTDTIEKMLAYAPPFVYSHITGIVSPTGAEAEGWLISVGGTPKELMAHSPEFTYARLLAAAETAKKLGAQIMGLGAFTKVVGDAGVTVAMKAPLPITTGNSYSASGALWAAHDALDRLGLAERDEHGRLKGKAMVVGATGSIGSVCARLLALAADELWLVSPESAKLLELKSDIERAHPRATIHVAATPDAQLPEMDLIVTATSGAGKRVLDIMAVKPGCIITDVARPLDLPPEDVAK